jgi:hypothetical protein
MIIIVASYYPSEAEIQLEIKKIQASPEGQDIFNQELLKEMAISRLLKGKVEQPVEEPVEQPVEEQEPTAQIRTRFTQPVPPDQQPSAEPETVTQDEEPTIEETGSDDPYQHAQKLYLEYQTANEERKNEIIREFLNIEVQGSTVVDMMTKKVEEAERVGYESEDQYEWLLTAIKKPNIDNFLGFFLSKGFKAKASKFETNFKDYFEGRGRIKPGHIPEIFKKSEDSAIPNDFVFRIARAKAIPLDPNQKRPNKVGYMGGRDISKELLRFESLDDVWTNSRTSEDAKLVMQYLEDLMVSESYAWNKWERNAALQDLKYGVVPAGYEGSRTYKAFENLNRVYSLVAPKLGLPTTIPEQDYMRAVWLKSPPKDPSKLTTRVTPINVIDPTDPNMTRVIKSYRTGSRNTLAPLSFMIENLIEGVIFKLPDEELKKIEDDVNATLPDNQKISLDKKHYSKFGKYYIERSMAGLSKENTNPSGVRALREKLASGKDVSMQATGVGDEGEATSHEYSTQEGREEALIPKRIDKPVISDIPSQMANGPLAPGIAKKFLPEVTITAKDIDGELRSVTADDPTWSLIDDIQTKTQELKKTMSSSPPPPTDVLVYPIRPMGKIRKTMVEIEPPEQAQQEFSNKITQIFDPEQEGIDVFEYLKKQLKNYTNSVVKDGVDFDIRPVAGRYLIIKPIGLTDPTQITKALKIADRTIARTLSHENLPQILDENGKVMADPETANEMVYGYLLSRSKDLSPTAYKNQFQRYIDEQAAKSAREEVIRNQSTEVANLLKIAPEEVGKRVDEFYKMLGDSKVVAKLKDHRSRAQLLTLASDKLYGKEIDFKELSKSWTRPDKEKLPLLKNVIAHDIAKKLVSPNHLDPVLNSVMSMVQSNGNIESDLMKSLSQAEKRLHPGLREGVYKIVGEVLGEMIGALMREEFGANSGTVQAAINMLRIVRLAISSRLMTKTG